MSKGLSRTTLANWAVTALLDGGDKTQIVQQLAAYLMTTKRVHEVDLLVNDVARALQTATGTVSAEVITARPLSPEVARTIEAQILRETGAVNVQMSNVVDESLHGGAIIKTPDAEQDASVRGALQRLTALAA